MESSDSLCQCHNPQPNLLNAPVKGTKVGHFPFLVLNNELLFYFCVIPDCRIVLFLFAPAMLKIKLATTKRDSIKKQKTSYSVTLALKRGGGGQDASILLESDIILR